nr:GNAT family N-acetyltransferase [Streptomyces thermoviolaceus]
MDPVPLRVEHATEMAGVLSDPALYTFIGGTPWSAAELRERYARLVAGSPDPHVSWCTWVLRLRAEGRLTGTVQATVAERPQATVAERPQATVAERPQGTVAGVAWVVGTGRQGRGLATEAARALVGALRGHRVRTVLARIRPAHHASAAVARAAGLAPTGELHDGEITWRLDLAG